jgi:syntaxin 5
MRQRRTAPQQQQQQDQSSSLMMQQQQQNRATQDRLQEARQAEKSLVELGTLFGKMSSLISQQSEVIDKIEDDVEAAVLDVAAGHAEITTLYSIKRGNRALILKVFGLLIFFIVFMRLYSR